MTQRKPPHIKAGTDGERIVLWIKNADREQFAVLLGQIRAMRSARFDWDEKVWHVKLTKANADRVLALGPDTEIAPALGAWIADHSIIERVTRLEEVTARITGALSLGMTGES